MKLLAVTTTLGRREDAQRIARALVERRLAACAQIAQIESCYVWQGELQQELEFRLLLKTTEAAYPALESALRELHPYELPAIWTVAVEHATADYAAWVEAGSRGS